jgi:hypothetical protein
MLSTKTLTCKGTLPQVFFCLRPKTVYPLPLKHCILIRILIYTIYLYYKLYTGYTYSHREGGVWGRVEPESRLEGQQFTGSKKLI